MEQHTPQNSQYGQGIIHCHQTSKTLNAFREGKIDSLIQVTCNLWNGRDDRITIFSTKTIGDDLLT